MRKVAFRGLFARRARLVLTALAVALGVTLIAGTYVFTDTINASFDRIFQESYAHTDAVVTPNDDIQASDSETPSMSEEVVDQVRAVEGVAAAEGGIFDEGATLLNAKGTKISATHGAPTFIASLHKTDRFEVFDVADGRLPAGAGEVAIDKALADRKHVKVGDTLQIAAQSPKRPFKVTGFVRVSGVNSFGGATIALMTLPEAQRMAGKVGRVEEIDASAEKGVTPARLKASLRAALPAARFDVRTGKEEAASQSADIRDNLGFLKTALLAFAGIALFVGAFIIFNTFSITVAQRIREFGLLRTLGATRGQVMRSVLAEGALLGTLGAAAGLGFGILLASGLRALFKLVGFDLPSNGTVVATHTIVTSLLVGILVTLASTFMPALRATRVPPVAALREGVALPRGRGARFATPVAVLLSAVGVGLMAWGLFGSMSSGSALSLMGAGAAAVFFGVALLSPRLVPPVARFVGGPLPGITGRLARENTIRQPGRTATTAAALMIGVALVAFASIFAASARRTIHDAVSTGSKAQAIIQNTDGFSPFSAEVAKRAAGVPGVERVSALRFVDGKVDGIGDITVTGVDPDFADLYKAGSPAAFRALGPGEAVASKGFAKDHGKHAGDVVRVRTSQQLTVALRIKAIANDKGHLVGDLTVSNAIVEHAWNFRKDGIVLVGYRGGKDDPKVKHALDSVLKAAFPQTEAKTNAEFIDNQANQINQTLYLIYALLALSIIVSLFGIVNTLVLSITERTRELGMLRAIGTSRRQVRAMVRYESVITALIGAILGALLGVLLAVLVSRPLDDFKLEFPIGSLLFLLVLSALAGVGAAALPARRAARLDVLEALAYE